jgi:hypothetical protein
MASKQFTAKTFTWLRQINRGRGYLAIDLKVALELTTYFNEDRAYPGYKTIADAIGLSERTVIRSIERMRGHGNLYVIPGKPGRGHPNQYWMIVKDDKKTCTQAQVLEPGKPAPNAAGKPANRPPKTCTATQENHKNPIPDRGSLKAPLYPDGERVRASREDDSFDFGGGLDGRPKSFSQSETEPSNSGREKKESVDAAKNSPPPLDHDGDWRTLRELWQRGHVRDDTPKAVAIARNAFAKACTFATPAKIIDAARAHVAAADAPRFLPALPQWLAAKGWQQPPPTKRHGGARPTAGRRDSPRRKGKVNVADVFFTLAEEYELAERGAAS